MEILSGASTPAGSDNLRYTSFSLDMYVYAYKDNLGIERFGAIPSNVYREMV